jgi:hypothetical protein
VVSGLHAERSFESRKPTISRLTDTSTGGSISPHVQQDTTLASVIRPSASIPLSTYLGLHPNVSRPVLPSNGRLSITLMRHSVQALLARMSVSL